MAGAAAASSIGRQGLVQLGLGVVEFAQGNGAAVGGHHGFASDGRVPVRKALTRTTACRGRLLSGVPSAPSVKPSTSSQSLPPRRWTVPTLVTRSRNVPVP